MQQVLQQEAEINPYQFQANPLLLGEDLLDLEKLKKIKSPNYEIEYGLSLDLKSSQRFIQIKEQKEDSLNIQLTLKTLNQIQYDGDGQANDYLKQRPNLDLIFVIDNSGSMNGDGIKSIKQSLEKVIEELGENDRISIIIFNSNPYILCNFRKLTKENKVLLIEQISKLEVTGLTNIHSAMEMAFDVLSQRKVSNQVTSIFLFSDGQETQSDEKIKESLKKNEILSLQSFTIYTFGFGLEHNPSQLINIANLKGGNYYYIEDLNKMQDYFLDVIGDLFMVIAKNVTITIELNTTNQDFNIALKNSKLTNQEQKFQQLKLNESYIMKIDQLIKGYEKQFMFHFQIPKVNYSTLQPFNKQISIITATLNANCIQYDKKDQVCKSKNLSVEVLTLNQIVYYHKDEPDFQYLMIRNFILYNIEQAIRKDINAKNKPDYLKQSIKQIEQNAKGLEDLNLLQTQYIRNITEVIKQIFNSKNFDEITVFKLINIQNAIKKQHSLVFLQGDIFQSQISAYLINNAKKQ